MALITGLGVLAVLAALLQSIIVAEVEAWMPALVRAIIRFAVGRLPQIQRERFEEEWQGHINEVPGSLGKAVVAVGFLIAAYDVSWNDRRNRLLGDSVQRLAQLDEVLCATVRVVNLIQSREDFASRESVRPNLNVLRSCLNELQGMRTRLETRIATTPGTLETLVSSLCRRKPSEDLLPFVERIRAAGAQIEKNVDQKA